MSLNLRKHGLRCGLSSPKGNSPIGKMRLPRWHREKNSPSKCMVKYWRSQAASLFLQNTWRSAKGRPTMYCFQPTTAGLMLRDSWPGLRIPVERRPFGSLQNCKCALKANLNATTFPEHSLPIIELSAECGKTQCLAHPYILRSSWQTTQHTADVTGVLPNWAKLILLSKWSSDSHTHEMEPVDHWANRLPHCFSECLRWRTRYFFLHLWPADTFVKHHTTWLDAMETSNCYNISQLTLNSCTYLIKDL